MVNKYVGNSLAFLKKILVRRILWNERKLEKEEAKKNKGSSTKLLSFKKEGKEDFRNFNQINSAMNLSLQKEEHSKKMNQELPFEAGNEGKRKNLEEILEIISVCCGILLGDDIKIRELSGKNIYLYLKLMYYFGEEGLDLKNL